MEGEELKIVIHIKEDIAVVGVWTPEVDPLIERVALIAKSDTELTPVEQVLVAIPDLVNRAREKWAASPRNPAYQGPPVFTQPPAQTPIPARPGAPASKPTKAAPGQVGMQI